MENSSHELLCLSDDKINNEKSEFIIHNSSFENFKDKYHRSYTPSQIISREKKPRIYGSIFRQKMPDAYDIRNNKLGRKFNCIYDQKEISSCSANAVCLAYEFYIQDLENMSRLFIYYNARLLDGKEDDDSGAQIYSVFKSLQPNYTGICIDKKWEYNTKNVNVKPSQDAYTNAKSYNATFNYIEQNLKALKKRLINNDPIVIGFCLYESFCKIDPTGKVNIPNDSDDELIGGHALVACGYDDNFVNNDHSLGAFTLINSWGETWGNKGYCYMPYSLILDPDFCFEFWYIEDIIIKQT